MTTEDIGQCTVDAADIAAFANAAGDWNPVHVDALAARRLLTGGLVAHGVSTLLWMLERHLASGGRVPPSLEAAFPRPLAPGDAVTVGRSAAADGSVRLAALVDGEEFASALLAPGVGGRVPGEPPQRVIARDEPQVHDFAALKNAQGSLPSRGLGPHERDAHRALCAALGPRPVTGLMAVSRLVGMVCPGLHSLIAALRVSFDASQADDALEWRVARHTVIAAPVRIAFSGCGIAGHVDAFVRPAPATQGTMADLRALVTPGEFSGQAALVIGGSRGLGEVAAKLLALGGAEVVLTFREGQADAQRVVKEIGAGGGSGRLAAFDTAHARRDFEHIVATLGRRSHVYYFAAPRIGRAKSRLFSPAALRDFMAVFVDAFGQVAAAAAASAGNEPVRIFYPSTVFLDDPPKDQAEYAAAKAAGEQLCAHFARHASALSVLVRRLPRLHTDQSAGLLSRQAPDPAPVLLAVLREAHRPQPTKAQA